MDTSDGLVPLQAEADPGRTPAEGNGAQLLFQPNPAESTMCQCLLCHETCVLGPLRLTGLAWASALGVAVVFLAYLIAVDSAHPLALAAVFVPNIVVLRQLWWRHREAASADMLAKVFGFTFFFGAIIASVIEVVLLLLGGLIFFGAGEDVSKVVGWCAGGGSAFAPDKCGGYLEAQQAADNASVLLLQSQGYYFTGQSCSGGSGSDCTCDEDQSNPPCPWLHVLSPCQYEPADNHSCQELLSSAEFSNQQPEVMQRNCTALRQILRMRSDPSAIHGELHMRIGVVLFLLFFGFVDAASVEEGVKLLAARGQRCPCKPTTCQPCCVPGWPMQLRDPRSYLVYMVTAAAGFSTVENLGYLFPFQQTAAELYPACVSAPGLSSAVANVAGRVLLAYPLHLVCGALTGVQLIRRHLPPPGGVHVAAGLGWPWVLLPGELDLARSSVSHPCMSLPSHTATLSAVAERSRADSCAAPHALHTPHALTHAALRCAVRVAGSPARSHIRTWVLRLRALPAGHPGRRPRYGQRHRRARHGAGRG